MKLRSILTAFVFSWCCFAHAQYNERDHVVGPIFSFQSEIMKDENAIGTDGFKQFELLTSQFQKNQATGNTANQLLMTSY